MFVHDFMKPPYFGPSPNTGGSSVFLKTPLNFIASDQENAKEGPYARPRTYISLSSTAGLYYIDFWLTRSNFNPAGPINVTVSSSESEGQSAFGCSKMLQDEIGRSVLARKEN